MSLPRAFLSVSFAVIALAAFAPAAPAQQSGLGPAPLFSRLAPGADATGIGVSTAVATALPGVPPQSEPFVVVPPAGPPEALTIIFVVAWTWYLDGPAPALDTIQMNGLPVTGQLVGSGTPGLCVGKQNAASYLSFQDANFGPIFPTVPNTVANATDRALGSDPLAFSGGFSVFCVYEFIPQSFEPLRQLDVYGGWASTESDPNNPDKAAASLALSSPYAGGPFHLILATLGGRVAPDVFTIGNNLPVGGTVAGTVSPTDAWQGLLGPSLTGVDNQYDHADDDISAHIATNSVGLTLATHSAVDCIAHVLAITSIDVEQPFVFWSAGKPDGVGLVPQLVGSGPMTPLSANLLNLTNGQQNLPATLVVGLASLRAPFKGGILGPVPDIVLSSFQTGITGHIDLPFTLPHSLPPGTQFWVQFWIHNPTATFGLSASNTLQANVL